MGPPFRPPSPRSPSPTTADQDASSGHDSNSQEPDAHKCLWHDCDKVMSDPEALYNHLCNDHIGRKSTNNLCLTCKWKDCGTTCSKRDHITSHVRVHTPLKPHSCDICKKSFKRPQDLKKHEKIHTEEHHAQHKHSKAITVADPSFNQRIRNDMSKPSPYGVSPRQHPSGTHGSRAGSDSTAISCSGSSRGPLSTPSPEMMPSQVHIASSYSHQPAHGLLPQNHLSTWEALRADGTPTTAGAGVKRSYDHAVDEFFTDMKKRRVTPSYDPDMAERLNRLAYSQDLSGHEQTHFNPRSVSFDIRTPEELAAVNDFLVTLGRDVASGAVPRQSQLSMHQRAENSSNYSTASMFDAESLSQMGLAGMPGLPGSGATYPSEHEYSSVPSGAHQYSSVPYPSTSGLRSNHPSVQPTAYTSLYSDVPHANLTYSSSDEFSAPPALTRRSMSAYSSSPYAQISLPPPELDSPHSSSSTPSAATPPRLSLSMPENPMFFEPVRAPRVPPLVPHLAQADYSKARRHTYIPLQNADAKAALTPPEPMEPKLPNRVHRGPPAKLTAHAVSSLSSSTSSRLYPLLKEGDREYKLPPLTSMLRERPAPDASPRSPPPRESTPSSGPSSPVLQAHTLPGIHAITAASLDERLSREVGRIQLESGAKDVTPEQRRRHAELIRDLLLVINADFRKRVGVSARHRTSPLGRDHDRIAGQSPRDVEMAFA
ncbi:hypothetical protein NEOLEDRAFT_1053378 [Neolentinus lepideus HHB14362 ss-1]|uniref:C2H2-type domain-containing protein n=1 Tax=Neolentinus lepideus HHB14362 ss-1 TaxID=1314782 RepID=A0A165W682_9AGAM|nr:hypothetical protein NEOLEDRAFT_1053378 [Neolentinus lepideus HHB14362 ss-1]